MSGGSGTAARYNGRMISFRNFALRRGERLLLSDVDLALHAGWRVGVIGRNGAGKSSLFAALMREVEADKGDLDLPGKARIASVAQETPRCPTRPSTSCCPATKPCTRHPGRGQCVRRRGLGSGGGGPSSAGRSERLRRRRAPAACCTVWVSPASDARKPVSDFSGGWRVRLNVARALMMPSDLLLLDEPTNHLDLDAVVWMEEWLKRYDGTLLVISHDREFLDNVTTHTLHLHEGKAKLYTGNYTDFERQRAEHLRQQQIAHEKEQAERAHLQSFIDRFKAKASKAKQAQSRMKRLAKLAGTEAVRAERSLHISCRKPLKLPNSLMSLNDVDCGYGADAVILHNVNFGLEAGDRIGLLGPNGAGKSTLVKTLVGELRADDRRAQRAPGSAHRLLRAAHGGVAGVRHYAAGSPARAGAGRGQPGIARFPRPLELPRRPRVRGDRHLPAARRRGWRWP
jgi:ATP-binding cassette subfamily F protein 3